MNKLLMDVKDFLVGNPESRFQDITTELDNIQSQMNLLDRRINNLLGNGDTKLSAEEAQIKVASLKTNKTELLKKLLAKRKELMDVNMEYKNRKVNEYKDNVKEREAAYVEKTGEEAKKTANAIAEARVAVRNARMAIRKRALMNKTRRHRKRIGYGGKKSSRKTRAKKD